MIILSGCSKINGDKNLLLKLKFDETSGTICSDSAKKLEPAKVQYVLSNASYQDFIDPQWRENGIKDGALQFDGYSSFIRYNYDEIKISGQSLSIDVWVAPRAYEWLDSNTKKLTAIVSQHSRNDNEGFILGLSEHGEWSFQVGLGDRWIEVWDEGHPIEKYEWTHIAAVFDGKGGELRIYRNGELVNTKICYENAKIYPALETPLLIGRNNECDTIGPFSKNMFSGLMDELLIYDTTLSEKQIKKSYESGLVNNEIKECSFDDIWFDERLLVNDVHKPTYHAAAVQHWMNEPHAPMYYNGKYHLYYQFNPFGPYWQQIHWGHWVSDDMVNWNNVKEALSPTKNSVSPDGVWSGGAAYKNDGTPVLLFTAGDDSRLLNPLSNQNIGIATPKNLDDINLVDWEMDAELAASQKAGEGRIGEFRDSHIWKEEDTWYMLVCSGSTIYKSGSVLCYTTTDDSFKNWVYRGSVYDWDAPTVKYGTSWELPIILPIKYEDGTDSGKYIFIFSPAPASQADNEAFYFIGKFDKETYKFIPDYEEPKLIDYGNNVFTGPSGFIDPVSGNVTIFSIIQDQRSGNDQYISGWAHGAGLTRVLTLDSDDTLIVKVTPNISNIISDTLLDIKDKSMEEANQLLQSIKGDVLNIKLKIYNENASKFGIVVRKSTDGTEKTQLYFDNKTNKIGVNTGLSSKKQNVKGVFEGDFSLDDNILEIDLYLDRSIIEGYFNSKNTITARVYPTLEDALGIELFSEDGDIRIIEMTVSKMKSIYIVGDK